MESEDKEDAKRRSRRRRSIRNLKEGLPGLQQSESGEGCLGSLWLESEEPVRKRKKRRSSLFTGLPAFHSTPVREENIRLDTSDVTHESTEHKAEKDIVSEAEVDRLCNVNNSRRNESQIVGCEASNLEKQILVAPRYEDESIDVCNRSLNRETESKMQTTGRFPDKNSSLCTEIQVIVDEQNESCLLSSPEVSLTKISPSSMSPDFPVSPALVSSCTNHGESFIESDTFITGVHVRPHNFGAVRTKHKTDILTDSFSDLNSSNKENISQNLDVTPDGLHAGDGDKASPSFFSLCKTIAGKVVTFVKTSPSYLTNAIMTTTTPPGVLKESPDVVNNDKNLLQNKVVDKVANDNSSNSRQLLQEKINQTLEEMEEQISAEITAKPKTSANRTTELKDLTKLVKPIMYNNAEIPNSDRGSDNKSSTKSTGSLKKKRDRTVFFETFNAISNVLNEDEAGSGDAVFGSNTGWLRVPRAPERPSSRSSSTSGAEIINKLMQEGASAGQPAPGVSQGENSATMADTHNYQCEQEIKSQAPPELSQNPSGASETPPVEKSFQALFLPIDSVDENTNKEKNESENEKYTELSANKSETRGMVTDETETADSYQAKPAAREDIDRQDKAFTGKDLLDYCVASADIQTDGGLKDGEGSKIEIDSKVVAANLEESEMSGKGEANVHSSAEERVSQEDSEPSLVVSKRKRKHQMPVKAYTEKTSLTEVKEATVALLEVIPEDVSARLTSQKKVKSKSVAAKRRSGQFNVQPEIPGKIEKKQELAKCSGPKRKKLSVASYQPDISESMPSEMKTQISSPTIEEGISMLAIEGAVDNLKTLAKPEASVKKRRRSAKFNVIVDIQKPLPEAQESKVNMVEASVDQHQYNQANIIPQLSNPTDTIARVSETKNDTVQDVVPENEAAVKPKGRGRRRRSSTFKDLASAEMDLATSQKDQTAVVVEDSPETAMELSKITKDISQVNLKETKSPTEIQVENQEITVDNLELPEDNIVPRRRRRRSAESASLKIQMYSEGLANESQESSPSQNVGPVITIKPSRKRKLDSQISEEELEKIYRNKNFVKPDERKPWQTIFESPSTSGDLYGKKRLQRFIEFEKPTQMKLRRRLQKAVKNGWDPKKKKRTELKAEVVELKLAALEEELDESSNSLTEKLKTIVDTQ